MLSCPSESNYIREEHQDTISKTTQKETTRCCKESVTAVRSSSESFAKMDDLTDDQATPEQETEWASKNNSQQTASNPTCNVRFQ